MKKVRKIEVPQKDTIRKLRVAAYCRVSTKYENQQIFRKYGGHAANDTAVEREGSNGMV